jgi:hypothetical protein
LLEEKLGKSCRGKRVEQSKITSSIMLWEPQAIAAQLLTKVAIVDASAKLHVKCKYKFSTPYN